MRDTIAAELTKRAAQTTSPEFYVLIGVVGALLAWVAYLYFNNKSKPIQQGEESKNGYQKDRDVCADVLRILEENRAAYQKLEQKLDNYGATISRAFEAITHDRGDVMMELGKMSGRVEEISKQQNAGR